MIDTAQLDATLAWLVDGAPTAAGPEAVLEALGGRLVAAGLPLARIAVIVRTLHPNVLGRRFTWAPGEAVGVFEGSYALLDSPDFLGSPVAEIYRTGRPVRLRLDGPPAPDAHGFLQDLHAAGVTDYLGAPMRFGDGGLHVVGWSTRAAAGFTEIQLAALDRVLPPFARVAEIWALRRTATTLLDTYVGRRSGARILAGHIRRGDVETIEAAFWYSDLRDFTALNEGLPPAALLTLLNEHFEAVAAAVAAQGGEVLQFIGDATLAIFPVGAGGRPAACNAALNAARAALAATAAANATRVAADAPTIRFGIGLHVGAVSWGNVGGTDRLGLNVIGPAVNRTARIETLTKQVGAPLLVSQDFAAAVDAPCRAVGAFTLKGVPEPQTLYVVDGLDAR